MRPRTFSGLGDWRNGGSTKDGRPAPMNRRTSGRMGQDRRQTPPWPEPLHFSALAKAGDAEKTSGEIILLLRCELGRWRIKEGATNVANDCRKARRSRQPARRRICEILRLAKRLSAGVVLFEIGERSDSREEATRMLLRIEMNELGCGRVMRRVVGAAN